MTKESGTTAISTPQDPAGPEPTGPEPTGAGGRELVDVPPPPVATDAPAGPATPDAGERPVASAVGTGWLAVLALVWLAVMLQSVQVSLRSNGGGVLGITTAAIGLPAVISAALVGGAAAGLAVHHLFVARLHVDHPLARFAVALGTGLLTGLAAAGWVMLGDSNGGSAVTVLGGTIAAAATIGGALAGLRAIHVVGAGVAASVGVFLLTFVRDLFSDELLNLFGAGESPASRWGAQVWLTRATSLAAGLAAGLIAFAYLRRASRRAGRPFRWPAYLVAGASAGVMMLLTEVITRVGGARVLALARAVSDSDNAFQAAAGQARFNSAVLVLFVGAITAIIAVGRTLGPKQEPTEPSSED
jgi:hypothetical protein